MRIDFEDGSFLTIDDMDEVLSISMFGLSGKKAIMSSSKLTKDNVQDIIIFLQKWIDFAKKG